MSHLGQRQFEVLAGAKSPFLPREDPSKKNLPKGIKNGAKKGSEKKKKVCTFRGDCFLIGVAISFV